MAVLLGAGATSIGAQAALRSASAVTAADVRFMQDMLQHHRQAVEMTALVEARTRNAQLRTLAERIAVSQADEMALMRRWLAAHGVTNDSSMGHAMDLHAGHGAPADAAAMPGMLSGAELRAMRAASGPRFDRLFLTGMIRHHGGALTMVDSLLATAGAAQESSINRFVSDVDADQRAEITRMRRLLSTR